MIGCGADKNHTRPLFPNYLNRKSSRIPVDGLCLIFFILISGSLTFHSKPLSAQSPEVLRAMAWEAYSAQDYFDAASLFEKVLLTDSSDLQVAWQLAESYRHDHAYTKAAACYQHLISLPDAASVYPDAPYYLALMLQQSGDRTGLCRYIHLYLEQTDWKGKHSRHAGELLKSCEQGSLQADSLPVEVRHLGTQVNSPWSEFAPLQINDSTLWFSALRPAGSGDFQTFSLLDYRTAIYNSSIRPSGFSRAAELGTKINKRNSHNANISFDPAGHRVFFSRCNAVQQSSGECRIMMAEFRNGRFGKAVPLDPSINLAGFSNTQPAYVRLKEDEQAVLYFVSNRPEGFGGMDVWYVVEQNGTFGKPVNCGSIINTPGNEVTPFYDTLRGCLWFASDWHPGFGGYDLFRADGGFAGWENLRNAGLPLNSPANEYYFSVNPTDSNGYFTSNRPGSFHIRGETCCNDIYMYEWIAKPSAMEPPPLSVIPNTPDSIQQQARNLLPLILFFHNDEPDPATRAVVSSKDYRQSLDEYVAMRSVYQTEYARGLEGKAAADAKADITGFFSDYVLNGYQKLEKLTEFLLMDLEAGRSVQLLVSGYCSPLSTNEYNINLARRRIHSLVKFLETAANGALKPYLDGTAPNSVRLYIFEDPVGKEKASPFVSDNPNDLRNSVYSRYAAFERRIEISVYQSSLPGQMVLLSELPKLVIPYDTLFAGRLQPGERKVVAIPIRNEGKSELLIRKIEFNYEILSVDWTSEPLLPGESRNLMVLIDPGQTRGPVAEVITLHTNLPAPVSLTISCYVSE